MEKKNAGWRGLPSRLHSEFQGMFRSLENPQMRLYFSGQLISVCGTWMQSVALSWLVYTLTDSALALGAVAFAGLLPVLLFSYFAGGVADRFDRRKVIMTTQSLALLEAVVLAALTLAGMLSVPILIALALFLGVCTAFEVPSRQAFVADIARPGELVNAVGLNSAMVNICRMLGPILAGVVVGLFGAAVCFMLNAVSYLAAIYTLKRIQVAPREKKKSGPSAAGESMMSVMRRTGVLDILVLTSAISIFGFQYQMLLPVIVGKVLHGDASDFAMISAISGAGSLIGSLALASRGKSRMLFRLLGAAAISECFALAILAWSQTFALSAFAVALAGACVSVFFVGGNSYVQTVVPETHRGRILGVYNVALLGVAPLGSLLGGWTAEFLGVSPALFISAAAVGLTALWYATRSAAGVDGEK